MVGGGSSGGWSLEPNMKQIANLIKTVFNIQKFPKSIFNKLF